MKKYNTILTNKYEEKENLWIHVFYKFPFYETNIILSVVSLKGAKYIKLI